MARLVRVTNEFVADGFIGHWWLGLRNGNLNCLFVNKPAASTIWNFLTVIVTATAAAAAAASALLRQSHCSSLA